MKKVEVQFTPLERRLLGIPQSKKQFGRDALALRRILDSMPFVLEAAEEKFHPAVCDAIVYREGMKAIGEHLVRATIESVRQKPSPQDSGDAE